MLKIISNKTTIWTIAIVAISLLPALPSAAGKVNRTATPSSGKLVKLTQGDLMCYVDVVDRHGKKHHLGADFEICALNKFLNKQVQLTYKPIRINDCQSNEPCGKSRTENAIVKMKLIRR
jgi:hypothetical protein